MNDEQNIIIYRTADGRASVALYAKDGKIWLNQQQMAELFATSKPNISMHIANILKEKELNEISVVKNYLTTAADGTLTSSLRVPKNVLRDAEISRYNIGSRM